MTSKASYSGDLQSSPNYERRLAMLQNVAELEPGQVAHAVEALTGRKVSGEPSFIPSGLGNQNWIVDTNAGRLVVKVSACDTPMTKWRAAALALDLAACAGLPVPRLVASRERTAALGSRALRIFEYIEGHMLDAPACLVEAPGRFWTELGAAIRCLHGIRLGGFTSRLDGSAPAFATWDAYLNYRIGQIQERATVSKWLDERALAPFWAALQATARQLAPAIYPALTHRDLHVDNLLVSPSGGLAAILDWDQAEAWDPVADFFKLQWLVFQEMPETESAFLAGYGAPADIYPHFCQRLTIASGIELVNMMAGALPDEGLAVRRLRLRLQQVALAAGWPDPGGIEASGGSSGRPY